jgi:DNA primase
MVIAQANPRDTRKYRGVSTVKPIDAAKEAVPTIDLADRLCGPGGLRRVGKEWAGRCPLPDHEDKTPSFTVSPEKNLFFCHGCLRGGDVVELARLVWGYSQREAAMAAANLLHEFGHEIPQRPPAWYRKQERQKPVRDAIEQAKIRAAQRRLYRWVFGPPAEHLEDLDERAEEMRRAWDDAGQVACMVARARGEAR